MMLDKDVFLSVIAAIQSQLQSDRMISAHLSAITGDRVNYDTGHALRGLINFLICVAKDEDRWIEYWLYDLEEGKKWRPGTIKVDRRPVRLKTPLDLYKLICREYKINANRKRLQSPDDKVFKKEFTTIS